MPSVPAEQILTISQGPTLVAAHNLRLADAPNPSARVRHRNRNGRLRLFGASLSSNCRKSNLLFPFAQGGARE
jgi:hypothetical protein